MAAAHPHRAYLVELDRQLVGLLLLEFEPLSNRRYRAPTQDLASSLLE